MRRLYKELENYGKSDFYPFHMPGHKRNKACIEGDFPIERDITEIDGFDDLHHSEGILLEAQNALSRMYGTRKSFFSVNGSTAGIPVSYTHLDVYKRQGKSTLGVVLAKILGYEFLDSDLLIQKEEKRRLYQIIDEEGEEGFKTIENRVCLLYTSRKKTSL